MPDSARLMPVQGYGDLLAGLPPGTVAAALMAALRSHEPEWNPGWDAYVCQCRDKGGARRLWPCPEVRAVTAALAGEEEL